MSGDCGVPAAAPSWAPKWVFCPEEKILSVVVEWIVAGLTAIGNALAGAIGAVFNSLGLAGSTAGDGLVSSFTAVADSLFGVAFALNNAILDIAASAGPAAPFVVVLMYSGVTIVLLAGFVGLKKVVLWLT